MASAETTQQPTVTPALEFVRDVSADGSEPLAAERDEILAERFRAAGVLRQAVEDRLEEGFEGGTKKPGLGILDTQFLVLHPVPHYRRGVRITPMGANPDILLGCLDVPEPAPPLTRPVALREGEVVDMLGTEVTVGKSRVAYVALNRPEVDIARVDSSAYLRYPGRLAVFDSVPNDDQLYEFTQSVAPDTSDFLMARIDRAIPEIR